MSSRRGNWTGASDDTSSTEGLIVEEIGRELGDARVEWEVRHLVPGIDPAEDLLGVAIELNADLMIIGLRRRSAVGKFIMGSTAQRVLLEASCPILAVKAEPKP